MKNVLVVSKVILIASGIVSLVSMMTPPAVEANSVDKLVNALSTAQSEKKERGELSREFGRELPVIDRAAKRNGCDGDLYYVLLAIRKAENGKNPIQFGVLAKDEKGRLKARGLEQQAGWAAATIVKNYQRWEEAGRKGDFIQFLGARYCPVGADNDPRGLNKHWVSNVTKYYNRYKKMGGE